MKTDIQENMDETVGQVREKARALTQRAKTAAQYTDDYVHDSPWIAVGAAVAAGVLLGLLFGRNR